MGAQQSGTSGQAERKAAQGIKMELYGVEMRQKRVSRSSRNQGRIYLPLSWLGKRVKIVRVD
ncbi:MAG: DUF2080 family transposase-associated protein [Proteobacteria bacterium]|nr:DUF2080 family transposase-associated protein [Pseudomonadota bacterium]MBU4381645.1 DUF2080 family transposase-associated protein [Pseudomonadota bacterium]MBU4606639.1 DUF2080 family transposase-associated protein [Pseudomonadota bacterium]MCG2766632.1 DUF2080 family transposase-associated protein [Desulfarculaceae bacterium]